jgi:hypothetical protein
MRKKFNHRTGAEVERAAQDAIGRQLRGMYSELMSQPLPESLISALRAIEGAEAYSLHLWKKICAVRPKSALAWERRRRLKPALYLMLGALLSCMGSWFLYRHFLFADALDPRFAGASGAILIGGVLLLIAGRGRLALSAERVLGGPN